MRPGHAGCCATAEHQHFAGQVGGDPIQTGLDLLGQDGGAGQNKAKVLRRLQFMHRKTLVHVGCNGDEVGVHPFGGKQLLVVHATHAAAEVARQHRHAQPVQDARHIDPATARVIEHGSATQFVNWADFVDGGQHIQRRVEGEAQYIGHAGNIPPCDVCRQRLPGLTRPQGLPSLVSAWQRVNNASPRVGCH